MSASSTDAAFASRVASVFGALGDAGGAASAGTPAWALHVDGTFRSGDAAVEDNSEDEEAGPQALSGADSEDEQAAYACKASISYRMAFEAEEDEDDMDRLAAGGLHGWQQAADRMPAGSTEVLEGNAYDRMHHHHHHHHHDLTAAAGGGAPHAAADDQVMADADDDDPPAAVPGYPGSAAAGAHDTAAAAPAPTTSTSSSVAPSTTAAAPAAAAAAAAAAARPSQPRATTLRGDALLQDIPLPGGDDDPAADAAARAAVRAAYVRGLEQHLQLLSEHEKQQQGQQQQQGQPGSPSRAKRQRSKRVSFADDVEQQPLGAQGRGAHQGGPGRAAAQGSGSRAAAGGGAPGRRGQQQRVPDHVLNPHRYTVYTLDEPIYVGQGDRSSSREDEDDDAQQHPDSRVPRVLSSITRVTQAAVRDAQRAAAAVRAGGGAAAAAVPGPGGDYMSAEQAEQQQQQQQQQQQAAAPGIKFRPSGPAGIKRREGGPGAPAVVNTHGAGKGAFLDEEGGPFDDPDDPAAAAAAAAAAGPCSSSGALMCHAPAAASDAADGVVDMDLGGGPGRSAAAGLGQQQQVAARRRQFRSKGSEL